MKSCFYLYPLTKSDFSLKIAGFLQHQSQFLSRYQIACPQTDYKMTSESTRKDKLIFLCTVYSLSFDHIRQLPNLTNSPRTLQQAVRIQGSQASATLQVRGRSKSPSLAELSCPNPPNGDSGLHPARSLLRAVGRSQRT